MAIWQNLGVFEDLFTISLHMKVMFQSEDMGIDKYRLFISRKTGLEKMR